MDFLLLKAAASSKESPFKSIMFSQTTTSTLIMRNNFAINSHMCSLSLASPFSNRVYSQAYFHDVAAVVKKVSLLELFFNFKIACYLIKIINGIYYDAQVRSEYSFHFCICVYRFSIIILLKNRILEMFKQDGDSTSI